jgi:hypothetical protein
MRKLMSFFAILIILGMGFSFIPAKAASPAPSMRLSAKLAGAPIKDIMPEGYATYYEKGPATEFTLTVSNVILPEECVLLVMIGREQMMKFTLRKFGTFIKCSTANGDYIPCMDSGTPIVIMDESGNTILAGSFTFSGVPLTSMGT